MEINDLKGDDDDSAELRRVRHLPDFLLALGNISPGHARAMREVIRRARKHEKVVQAARRPRRPRTGSVREALERISSWRQMKNLTLARRLQKQPAFKNRSLENLRRVIQDAKKSEARL